MGKVVGSKDRGLSHRRAKKQITRILPMFGLLTGMDRADLPLPMTKLTPVPSAPFVSRIYQSAFTANQILKSI